MATKITRPVRNVTSNGVNYRIEYRYDENAICEGVFLIITGNGTTTTIERTDERNAIYTMNHLIAGDYELNDLI